MSTLVVPTLDEDPWPTLGPDISDWIEDRLVYGPGELKGEPYKITPEYRGLLYRMYEVYPKGHKLAGRRRFKRAQISLRKGTAKTEFGAILSIAEAHPEAPVRCDGWDADGNPVGVGVRSPYIPMVAFSLTQTEDLAFAVARMIVEESEVIEDFDVGMERIMVLDHRGKEAGKIVPLGGSPNARDGARTTFQFIDEVHRLYMPRLKNSHNVMVQNMYKRVGADAWMLETTTAYDPGQQSIGEESMNYAKQIASGKAKDSRLFYFHRQADDDMPLETKDDVMAALVMASGPAASWSGDLDALVDHYFEPGTDLQYYRRVWLNQAVAGSGKAFNFDQWNDLADPQEVEEDELITLGFDGARRRDATALIGTVVDTGYQFVLGVWERPEHAGDDWEMPSQEIDDVVQMAFDTYDVWALYADPPYWADKVDEWAGRFGDKKVISWWTNRRRPMAYALANFAEAINVGTICHDGDPMFAAHIGNTFKQDLTLRDIEDDKPLWNIRKERPDSPNKIDAAMSATLSWEARGDCMAKGSPRSRRRSKKLVSF